MSTAKDGKLLDAQLNLHMAIESLLREADALRRHRDRLVELTQPGRDEQCDASRRRRSRREEARA